MANTNWLMGMRCPACGSRGPFWVDTQAVCLLGDDGPLTWDDPEWSRASATTCTACRHVARAADFGFPLATPVAPPRQAEVGDA